MTNAEASYYDLLKQEALFEQRIAAQQQDNSEEYRKAQEQAYKQAAAIAKDTERSIDELTTRYHDETAQALAKITAQTEAHRKLLDKKRARLSTLATTLSQQFIEDWA